MWDRGEAGEFRGLGRGHWVMPPLGAGGALCDCSASSNRECFYRENVPSNDEKSLQELFGPAGALRHPPTTKSSSERSLQWRPYGALLGSSGALLALAPHPFHEFPNTLLGELGRKRIGTHLYFLSANILTQCLLSLAYFSSCNFGSVKSFFPVYLNLSRRADWIARNTSTLAPFSAQFKTVFFP